MGIMACPQHPLIDLNDVTRKCDVCDTINNSHLAGRSKKRGHYIFKPDYGDRYPLRTDGTVANSEDFGKWLQKLVDDPVRLAQAMADVRRPGGVSGAAHGVAIRSAVKEPMLSAENPFGYLRKAARPKQAALLAVVKRFPVKPNNYKVALGNWLVREWSLWTLKYTAGFVIMDDKGNQSNSFASWHLAKEAIEASGYTLVKLPGRQDSL